MVYLVHRTSMGWACWCSVTNYIDKSPLNNDNLGLGYVSMIKSVPTSENTISAGLLCAPTHPGKLLNFSFWFKQQQTQFEMLVNLMCQVPVYIDYNMGLLPT
jgi:hypothetical protein